MIHLARCSYQRFQLASRHLRPQVAGGWSSSLNHGSFERSIHLVEGLLHAEGYHVDDICEFARERRMNVFMRSHLSAEAEAASPRDLLVAFDFGMYRVKERRRCLWVGAVKPDMSRLRPLYRYVCNIKMKLNALPADLEAYQQVDDRIHALSEPGESVPQTDLAASHRSPLFIDEARVSSSLQLNLFKRDKQIRALLEKLSS